MSCTTSSWNAVSPLSAKNLMFGGAGIFALRAAGILLALLANALLARMLTKEDYGNFIWFSSLLTLGGCVGRLGMERLIPRFLAESLVRQDRAAYYLIFRRGALISLASTLLLIVVWSMFLCAGGLRLLDFPDNFMTVVLTSLNIAMGSLLVIAAESLRGLKRLFPASLLSAEASSPFIAAVFLCQVVLAGSSGAINLQDSLTKLFTAMAATGLTSMLLLSRVIRTSAPSADMTALAGKADLSASLSLRGLCLAGGPIMLTQLFAMICMFSDVWVAKLCCAEEQLALMGASRRLAQLVSMPMTIMNLTVTAVIAGLFAEKKLTQLQTVLQRSATLSLAPGLLAMLLLLCFPRMVLAGVYGAAYVPAGPLLATMAVGLGSLCWAGSAELCLMLTGRQRISMAISAAAGVAMPVAGCLVANPEDAWSIAAVSSLVLTLRSLAMWIAVRITLGIWTNPDWNSLRADRKAAGAAARRLATS